MVIATRSDTPASIFTRPWAAELGSRRPRPRRTSEPIRGVHRTQQLTLSARQASLAAPETPVIPCARCRHDNRPQAKFCEECGTPSEANLTSQPSVDLEGEVE